MVVGGGRIFSATLNCIPNGFFYLVGQIKRKIRAGWDIRKICGFVPDASSGCS